MENDMNGNKLPLGLVELDRLEVLVIVDNETDTLSSVDEGIPQIPEMIHRTALIPPTRIFDGRDCKVILDQLCCACHVRTAGCARPWGCRPPRTSASGAIWPHPTRQAVRRGWAA